MKTPESRKEVDTILVAMDKATKRLEAEMGKIAIDLSRLGQVGPSKDEDVTKAAFDKKINRAAFDKKMKAAAEE